MRKIISLFIVLSSALLVVVCTKDSDAQKGVTPDRSISTITTYLLESEDGSILPGVEVFHQEARGATGRALFRSPGGRHFVLENSLDPVLGVATFRVIDDETGWWIESVASLGYTAPTMSDFFALDLSGTSDKPYAVTLRTKAGLVHAGDYVESTEGHGVFIDGVRASSFFRDLAGECPSELEEGVNFLATLLEGDPNADGSNVLSFTWRPTIDTVQSACRASVQGRAAPWRKTNIQERSGTAVIDPQMLEFVSGFQGVENADPLAGARVREVLGEGLN